MAEQFAEEALETHLPRYNEGLCEFRNFILVLVSGCPLSSEGFYIPCATCSTRLKVADISAIGQIFGCPKCGSMVLVEAPEGMELEPSTTNQTPEGGEADVTDTNDPTGLQPSDWASNASPTSWLGTVIGSVAAVLVVGSIGTYAWLNRGDSVHQTLQASPAEDIASVAEDATDAASNPADALDADGTAEQQTGASELADSRHTESPDQDGGFESTAQNPTDGRVDVVTVDVTDPAADKVVDLGVGQEVTDNVAVDEVFDESAATTLDAPPASSLLTDSSISPKLEPARSASDGDTLSSLARLLANPKQSNLNMTFDIEPDKTGTDIESNEKNDVAVSATADDNRTVFDQKTTLSNIQSSALSSHSSSKHDVEAKLSREILAVRFNRVPLIDFLRSMSQICGVPIQLDPAAVMQTSASPTTAITVSAIEKSALDVLTTALRPIKLAPVVHGHVVRIVSPRSEEASLVDYSFFVGDLSKGRSDELDLAALVTALVAPESWLANAASIELRGDRLKIKNSRRVLYQTLVLLEKLRKTRGLASRKKVSASLASQHSRWSLINRYLARPISVNMWQPQAWPVVVKELEKVTGLRILVDWHSLSETGLSLDSTAMLRVRDERAEVLTDWLESFDLVLLPLGGKTVQLTSRNRMEQTDYLDVYPLSKLSEKSMARVEQLLLNGAAALDNTSDFALVRANSETHRRLEE